MHQPTSNGKPVDAALEKGPRTLPSGETIAAMLRDVRTRIASVEQRAREAPHLEPFLTPYLFFLKAAEMYWGFAAAIESAARKIRKALAAYQRMRDEFLRTGDWLTLIEPDWPIIAAHYCAPYDRELRALGLPPLQGPQRREILLNACLLGRPGEISLARRMPLVEVALVAPETRHIAAGILATRGLRTLASRHLTLTTEQEEEMQTKAFVALSEQILPSIQRRVMKCVPQRAREVLAQVTRDAYLVRSLVRAIVPTLRSDRKYAKLTVVPEADESKPEDEPEAHPADGGYNLEEALDRLVVAEGIEAYLARRGAKDVDREMIAILREDPETPVTEIARRLGVPEGTLRYRLKRLKDYLAERLREKSL